MVDIDSGRQNFTIEECQRLRGIMGSITHHNQDLLGIAQNSAIIYATHSHSTLDTTADHDTQNSNQTRRWYTL